VESVLNAPLKVYLKMVDANQSEINVGIGTNLLETVQDAITVSL
jgi:hypothetical protein